MEGGTSSNTLPSSGFAHVNMLRGWLKTRNEVRVKLVKTSIWSLCFAGVAIIALPMVIWLFKSEHDSALRSEAMLTQVKRDLKVDQARMESAQPKIERAQLYEGIENRSIQVMNSVLGVVAATPNQVVLSSVSGAVSQGKLTMRILADAPNSDQKSLFEAQASRGPRVLAAFTTNQTKEENVFSNGIRFEFVKISEVKP